MPNIGLRERPEVRPNWASGQYPAQRQDRAGYGFFSAPTGISQKSRLVCQISCAIQAGSRVLVDCRARHSLAGSSFFSFTAAPRE